MTDSREIIKCACPARGAELCADLRYPESANQRERYRDGLDAEPDACECDCHHVCPECHMHDCVGDCEDRDLCPECGSGDYNGTETVCLACSNRAGSDLK